MIVCSICQRGIGICKHIPGKFYDNELCVSLEQSEVLPPSLETRVQCLILRMAEEETSITKLNELTLDFIEIIREIVK